MELSVYDNEEQCTFIILGDAGKELTGRKATELIDMYTEVSENLMYTWIFKVMRLVTVCCYIRKMVAMVLNMRSLYHNVSLIP